MPIRFHCSGCQYLLQVPDDAAGKKARCPRCQAVADVPWSSQVEGAGATFGAAGGVPPPADNDPYRLAPEEKPPEPAWATQKPLGPLPTKPVQSDNPYQSPSYGYDEPKFGASYASGGQQPLQPTRIVLEKVFSYGWEIYKANLGILIGSSALVLGLNYLNSIAGNAITRILIGQEVDLLIAQGAAYGLYLLTWPILTFLEIGQAIIFLKVARGERAEFSEMFSGGRFLLRGLGGDFCYNTAVSFGICMLIVPGVLLALMWWPYYLFIIDRDQRVFESFNSAQQFTEGNKGTMFVVFLANFGIMLAGCLALGVGVIFAFPLISMIMTVSYLMMTGQFYKRA